MNESITEGYIGRTKSGELVVDILSHGIVAVGDRIRIDGVVATVTRIGHPYLENNEYRRYLGLQADTAIGLQERHNRPVAWNKPGRKLPDGVKKNP